MTIDISSNNPKISYAVASGVTQTYFAIPFEFFSSEDLTVYVDHATKVLGSDYTVSGGEGSSGTLNISVTGISGGTVIDIVRHTEIERATDFVAGMDINRAALNTQLDTLTTICSDLEFFIDRSITLKDYDVSVPMDLPLKNDRLGKFLGFNSVTGAPEPRDPAVNSATVTSVTSLPSGSSPAVTATYIPSTGDVAFTFALPDGPTGSAGSDGFFSDLATTAEAQSGTNNDKGMSPLRVKEAIDFNSGSVSNAAFYGFSVNASGSLEVDYTTAGSTEAFVDDDYDVTLLNANGLTFQINTAGHLLLVTP